MHAISEIITFCLLKKLLVFTAFRWTFCESRHLTGIGTRVVGISHGGLFQPYTTTAIPTTGVTRASWNTTMVAMEHDHHQRPGQTIPAGVWLFMTLVIFFFAVLCICFCAFCQMRRTNLRRNARTTSSLPRFNMHSENVRTPVSTIDRPPDYAAVVHLKTVTANNSDSLTPYPKVVEGKKLETPPPAYITVGPFM